MVFAAQNFHSPRLRGRFQLLSAGLAAVVVSFSSAAGETDAFYEKLDPFFAKHCYECHDDLTAEADLDLMSISLDLEDPGVRQKWIRIFDRVMKGEMPPEEQPRPAVAELARFETVLRQPIEVADAAERGTVLRRLNRREYEYTLNDLFGTHAKLAELLPEDGRGHVFDNVGEALGISMIQMERYLDAIQVVLDEAIAKRDAPPEPKVIRANYADSREGKQFIGKAWHQLDDGAVVFYRESGYPSGMLRGTSVSQRGLYKIRVTGYAHQSEKPVYFSVEGTSFQRGSEKPVYGYFSMPPGKPTTVELEAWIEDRYMVAIEPWGLFDTENLIKKNGIAKYPGPGLAIQEVALEGPIVEEFPSRGHQLLFEGVNWVEIEPDNPRDKNHPRYVPQFTIETDDPRAHLTPALQRVASAAFRRPVTVEKIEPYLALMESELEQGETVEGAYLTAVKAIFCAPDFLFLREKPGELDDFELASRLSYFLTRTAPDAELMKAAAAGKLSGDPKELRRQTERLIEDPRFDRFVEDFTDGWLNLRDIDFTMPDGRLFPEYDLFLRNSLLEETRAFVKELVVSNHRARNLADSDFAMLNVRLAQFYGIPGVDHVDVRPVSLPADSVRGGLMTQGSILKVSANGTNTSPILRGVWVMERIFGEIPPPPPPGIPGVEPDIRGAETLRQLLDKHRDMVSCRACHQAIDPPGFALESFNPIGGWREQYRSLGEGERITKITRGRKVSYKLGLPVDASGYLPDGREFSGFREFRELIGEDEDALAKTLAKKLLVFSTGREMGFSDRPEIKDLVKASGKQGHGVRDMMHLVVASDVFRQK